MSSFQLFSTSRDFFVKNSIRYVLGASVVAATMVFGFAGGAINAQPAAAASSYMEADQVFNNTNGARAMNGRAALKRDATLDAAAQAWANQMSTNNFAHSSSAWRAARIPAGWTSNGENIAIGYTSASAVIDGWINSPGHLKNLLEPKFTRLGVGYNPSTKAWVQIFAGYPGDKASTATAAAPSSPSVAQAKATATRAKLTRDLAAKAAKKAAVNVKSNITVTKKAAKLVQAADRVANKPGSSAASRAKAAQLLTKYTARANKLASAQAISRAANTKHQAAKVAYANALAVYNRAKAAH